MVSGRPRKEIDYGEFEKLCFMQCSILEMCEWFHITHKTLEKRVKEHYGETFSQVFAKKRTGGLISLRRNLLKQSENNPATAIFLAKNWLGMADKQDIVHTGDESKPIGVKHVNFDPNKVASAIIEAMRLGIDPGLLGGDGHGEDASVLSSSAHIQAVTLPESSN